AHLRAALIGERARGRRGRAAAGVGQAGGRHAAARGADDRRLAGSGGAAIVRGALAAADLPVGQTRRVLGAALERVGVVGVGAERRAALGVVGADLALRAAAADRRAQPDRFRVGHAQ